MKICSKKISAFFESRPFLPALFCLLSHLVTSQRLLPELILARLKPIIFKHAFYRQRIPAVLIQSNVCC